jgi:hypothetical protein
MEEVQLTIRLRLRRPINKRDLKAHVKDAVESWGGCRHPDDPLFDGIAKATVTIMREV